MFRIVRSFFLAVLFTLAWACAGYAQSVPLTGGEYNDGTGWAGGAGALYGGMNQRNTCDPDVMEVLKNQAWEAAQREITQNANLYARPDSVLSLSCFDSWLNHQVNYAENNFPQDPDESEGYLLGGLMTDLLIVLIDDIITGVDTALTDGYVQYGFIELLILDQLEPASSLLSELQDLPGLILCGDKDRYIHDAFPDLMIGDRAKNQGAVPAYSQIGSGLNHGVSAGGYNCNMMQRVWHRTKCYDFATEEDDFYNLGSTYTGTDHDGFYTYDDYMAFDHRTEPNGCPLPDNDYIDWPSAGDVICWIQIHSTPGLPVFPPLVTISLLPPSITGPSIPVGSPTWAQAHNAANPAAGAPGAGDAYQHFLSLVSGNFWCAPPIRTGFVVTRTGSQYYDAVCPNPGCHFNAPANLAGTGSCSY